MSAVIWHLLMLIWLAALGYGAWWVWPNLENVGLNQEFLTSLLWLLMGGAAWVLAFNYGRARYWRR